MPHSRLSPALIFRSFVLSLLLTVAFAPLLGLRYGWPWAGQFAFFAGWSVANLYLFARALINIVQTRSILAAVLELAGLGALFAILLLFFARVRPNLWAFVYGFHLPYAVMILGVLGWRLAHGGTGRSALSPDGERTSKTDG